MSNASHGGVSSGKEKRQHGEKETHDGRDRTSKAHDG